MANKIQDPVFGHLTWDVFWEGTADVPMLGGTVSLSIDTEIDESPPTDRQRRAFQEMLGNGRALRAELERALFDYYNRVKEAYRAGGVGEVPDLKSSPEIWKLVREPSILVRVASGNAAPRLKISWECEWDDEHGVEVTVVDSKAIHADIIGGADEI